VSEANGLAFLETQKSNDYLSLKSISDHNISVDDDKHHKS